MIRRHVLRAVSLCLPLAALSACASRATPNDAFEVVARDVIDVTPPDIQPPIDAPSDTPGDTPGDTPADLVPFDVAFTSDASVTARCGLVTPGTGACPGLCGNARIDSCQQCFPCGPPGPDVGVCCTTRNEECDGVQVSTCTELGYRAGMTSCTNGCVHDTSACERCSNEPQVAACLAASAFQSASNEFGLASSGDRVALAWASLDPAGTGLDTLQVSLLDASLATLARSPCLLAPGIGSVSVVPSGTGWLVAYQTAWPTFETSNVYLQRFDHDALPIGGPALVGRGADPRLTAGDGSIVLLEYERRDIVIASLLHSDGTAATGEQIVFEGIYGLEYESAAWVGDAFLLSAREFRPPVDATAVVRLERDGRVTARTQPIGRLTEWGQLVVRGSSIALVYGSFGGAGTMQAQPLDARGNPAGGSTTIGAAGFIYGPMYPVAQDAGYLLIQSDSSSSPTLRAGRFDTAFRSTGALWPVGRGGSFSVSDHTRVTTVGTRVIVAWTDTQPSGGRALAVAAVQP